MTVAITCAKNFNYSVVIAASTGNTAASASAYSARTGMTVVLILPRGKVAVGKMGQSYLHGARVIELEGNFDDGMKAVLELYKKYGTIYPLNSFNPLRLEGQKTIAYEIVEEIRVSDFVIVPVGNGGNIYAIWKGFMEMRDVGLIERVPKMIGVQAKGASTVARTIIESKDELMIKENPETVASAIKIGRPVNWRKAIRAIRISEGSALEVTDDGILSAQKDLARLEGIEAELASASTLAGYKKALELGIISLSDVVVNVITGHALKDPDIMLIYKTNSVLSNSSNIIDTIIRLIPTDYISNS